MLMCGCTPISDLGCFSSCDPINTKILASATGTWVARVCFNGVWLSQKIEATENESIVLPNSYPEDLVLTLMLIKPDGTPFGGGPYSFKNKIVIPI